MASAGFLRLFEMWELIVEFPLLPLGILKTEYPDLLWMRGHRMDKKIKGPSEAPQRGPIQRLCFLTIKGRKPGMLLDSWFCLSWIWVQAWLGIATSLVALSSSLTCVWLYPQFLHPMCTEQKALKILQKIPEVCRRESKARNEICLARKFILSTMCRCNKLCQHGEPEMHSWPETHVSI